MYSNLGLGLYEVHWILINILDEQNEASGDDSDDNDDESDKKTKLKYKKSLEDPERLKRTIFVGNIPVTLKKKVNFLSKKEYCVLKSEF